MKRFIAHALLGTSLAGFALAQTPTAAPQAAGKITQSTAEISEIVGPDAKSGDAASDKFNLDFKGGSIHQLFDAIGYARGKAVNVVIPQLAQGITIPPFKTEGTAISAVMTALNQGVFVDFEGPHGEPLAYHFDSAGEKGSEVWYVSVQPNLGPDMQSVWANVRSRDNPECRAYLLTPFLDGGLSVDDITTAIRTAWKMLDHPNTKANLSYHRETKLLIAVAPSAELQAIEQVLNALQQNTHIKKATAPASAPVVSEKAPAIKS